MVRSPKEKYVAAQYVAPAANTNIHSLAQYGIASYTIVY